MKGSERRKQLIATVGCLAIFSSSILLGTVKYFAKRSLFQTSYNDENWYVEHANASDHSINATSCKSPTIHEFPSDFLPFKDAHYLRLTIHSIIIAYLLVGVSIVCDDYFIDSLSKLSNDLNLKEDVAGATFMAAGTSAPELFTSIIGVIFAKSDIGTGTIVGSAIFNVLFILAICALAAKTVLLIDWFPISRDCVCYLVSICALIIVLYDGSINWIESIFLLVLYGLYILVMYFNDGIEKWSKKTIQSCLSKKSEQDTSQEPAAENMIDQMAVEAAREDNDDPEAVELLPNPFERPTSKSFLNLISWAIILPLKALFYYTIPDTRREKFGKFPFYFITFFVSTVYVGVFTYGVVWMVVIIAHSIQIPDTVAGLTVLAAGTSLPEVVSSIIITRKGKGEMAISNSIGSNLFDILVCLGLPWFLETLMIRPFQLVKVYSGGIFYSALLLWSSVIILIASFLWNKWCLDKKFGILMLILWSIITILACLFEMNVFGEFSLPECH